MQVSDHIGKALVVSFFVALILLAFSVSGLAIFSILGVALFCFFCVKFFFELGHIIEVRDLIILIALLQWIIGPVLAYHFYPDSKYYYMAVTEITYMDLVFPATSFFIVGLYLPFWIKTVNEQDLLDDAKEHLKQYPNIDLILIGIGIITNLAVDVVPGFLRFFLVLVSSVRFIGLYFLILTDRNRKWLIFSFVIGWFFLETIRKAMFHELLLWLGFMFIIIALLLKFSDMRKLWYSLALLSLVFIIQTVKFEFRKYVWYGKTTQTSGAVFTDLVLEHIEDPEYMLSEGNFKSLVTRINQGWIIARIMSHTPSKEPFANGETIRKALEASLLPRFLAPNKAKAGGHENFQRFTGKELLKGTSMNLSPLGEAYANFGIAGAYLFMLILGLFYNFYIHRIFKLSILYPTLILWLPLLFLQVVKAESDVSIVLNHLIKSSIVVGLFYWGFNKFLGIRL